MMAPGSIGNEASYPWRRAASSERSRPKPKPPVLQHGPGAQAQLAPRAPGPRAPRGSSRRQVFPFRGDKAAGVIALAGQLLGRPPGAQGAPGWFREAQGDPERPSEAQGAP